MQITATIKQVFFPYVLALLFHCMASSSMAATGCEQSDFHLAVEAIPPHSLTYRNNYAPAWKANWDKGRKLFHQKQYEQAAKQYEQLLRQKENIVQARWEYIFVLMRQQQWKKAERELAILLAQNPQRPDYLLAKAEINLENGQLKIAAETFDRLYRQQRLVNRCQEDLIRILSGYVVALEKMKRFDILLPLMEELKILQPPGYNLQEKTATIAMEKDGHSEPKKH